MFRSTEENQENGGEDMLEDLDGHKGHITLHWRASRLSARSARQPHLRGNQRVQ